jgi:hypothetical protein
MGDATTGLLSSRPRLAVEAAIGSGFGDAPCQMSEPPSRSATVGALRSTRLFSRRHTLVIHRPLGQRPARFIVHSRRSVARFGLIDQTEARCLVR